MSILRVAAVQMTSTPDRSGNLAQARALIEEAAFDRGVHLVALPEVFSFVPDSSEAELEGLEGIKDVTVETLQEWASEFDVWIHGGSILLKNPKNPRKGTNTSLLINPDGDIVSRYDKIHLFEPLGETENIVPGKKVVVADTEFGSIGLSICYDLRFPELYREQSAQGADLLIVPSAFTVPTGQTHWDVLTRARAIENQCFLIAPAQSGQNHEKRESYGYTRIIDPRGRIIAERPAGPGVVWADLDLEAQERYRHEFPVLKHRRLGLKKR